MTDIADRFVVILDANVLYPYGVRDLLLWFAHAGLYRARWTDEIIDEWRRNVVANKPSVEQSINEQITAMRDAFDEGWVHGYQDLIGALTLPDPDDRHVLAAAIRCGAQNIVTENLKHFPADVLKQYDIEALSADEFLISTFELYPLDAMKVLKRIRVGYEYPPYTKSEFITHLMRIGLGQLAIRANANIDLL